MLRPIAFRVLAVVVLVAALAGGAAWAASGGGDADPAPPPATKDVPGLVSLARPITPIAVASTPPGALEMRITEPGGRRRAVLAFRETRTRTGRRVDQVCTTPGPESQLRALRRVFGSCFDPSGGDPWAIITGASSDGTVEIGGLASDRVQRLTIAGPGGTFVVPRSRSGAFLVVYGGRATGRAVVTATLTDGATRFFRTQIPPSLRPPGVTTAADPGGLPDWYLGAATRDHGPRKGQTCAQVRQDLDIRAKARRQGGALVAPACGDLRRAPIFARTVRIGRDPQGTFSLGPRGPRRTILLGAARADVRAVAVVGPGGRRELPLADASRAFLAVFSERIAPSQLTLEVTRADGRVERVANPVAVNRATTEFPPPRLAGKVRLRLDQRGSRRVVLRATLTGPPKRFEITFLGREVRMRRVGGTATRPAYVGVYDGTRGVRRPLRPGTTKRFTLLICGDTCSTGLQRARLR